MANGKTVGRRARADVQRRGDELGQARGALARGRAAVTSAILALENKGVLGEIAVMLRGAALGALDDVERAIR